MAIFTLNYHKGFPSLKGAVPIKHVALFMLFFPFLLETASAALTATSSKTIQGRKPELSQQHLTTINENKDFPLFWVDIDGNSYNSTSEITTKLKGLSNLDIGSITPAALIKKLGNGSTGVMTVKYKTVLDSSDADDSDGDHFVAGSLSGSAVAQWGYKVVDSDYKETGEEIALTNDQMTGQTFCQLAGQGILPFIKISGPVTLTTEYGEPDVQTYDITMEGSPIYGKDYNPVKRVYPGIVAACFARPAMRSNEWQYAGPSDQWDNTYGYIVQDIASNNFPSTGANGLYFDLVITGIDVNELDWSMVAEGNISVKPSRINPSMVRFTLTGPDVSDTKTGSTAPVFSGPLNLSMAGVSSDNFVTYSFVLQKWFINRKSKTARAYEGTDSHLNFCNALDASGQGKYIMAGVSDLTSSPWTPESGQGPNLAKRGLGNGLFGEWGAMAGYTGSNFTNAYYRTSLAHDTAATETNPSVPGVYTISAANGNILVTQQTYAGDYGICVSN